MHTNVKTLNIKEVWFNILVNSEYIHIGIDK